MVGHPVGADLGELADLPGATLVDSRVDAAGAAAQTEGTGATDRPPGTVGRSAALPPPADLPERAAGSATADPAERAELGLRLVVGQGGCHRAPAEPEQSLEQGTAATAAGKQLGQGIETAIVHRETFLRPPS
jgi:hypothetical protein